MWLKIDLVIYYACSTEKTLLQFFLEAYSINSEASASEFENNPEEMLPPTGSIVRLGIGW